MSNVVYMHFAHGARWVWDPVHGWIAPPRPRNRPKPRLVRKVRHYIPTFAKYGERRFARPTDAYDVMRVRDSWLCAQLADELLTQLRAALPDGWHLADAEAFKSWQANFERMMQKLGGDSWSASIRFHLTRRKN